MRADPMKLTITLHVDTINAALAALAKLPYEHSQPHIDAIRDTASAAIQQGQLNQAGDQIDITPNQGSVN